MGTPRSMRVPLIVLLLWSTMMRCEEDVLEMEKRWQALPNWMQGLRHPFLEQWKSDGLTKVLSGSRSGDKSEAYNTFKDSPAVYSLTAHSDSLGSIPKWSKTGRDIRSNEAPVLNPWSKAITRFKLLRLKKWRSLPNRGVHLFSSLLGQQGSSGLRSVLLEMPTRSRTPGQMILQGPTVIQGLAKPFRL